MTDDAQAFFAPPSLEGAQLALADLLVEGKPQVEVTHHCAIAIDVFNKENILIQRALAHAEVSVPIRDAFRELVDRWVTRFADAQDLDRARMSDAGPYRGGIVHSNEFSGFDCGYALAVARGRVAKLRAGLRSADELIVRLYAVPFLVATIRRRGSTERVVILRKEDGEYVHEPIVHKDESEDY